MPNRPVTVTTSVTPVCSDRGDRRSVTIFNNGAVTVFLSNDPADVLTRGWPLPASASVGLVDVDGDEPWLQLWGQCSAGSADLRVVEGFGRDAYPSLSPLGGKQ